MKDTSSLLAYFGVPLPVTTDNGFFALTSDARVVATLNGQVDDTRTASYAQIEVLESRVIVLSTTSALYRGAFPGREEMAPRSTRSPPPTS